jgi:hypothetical protein
VAGAARFKSLLVNVDVCVNPIVWGVCVMTFTAVDVRPSYERVLAVGLTLAEVYAFVSPAGVWALSFRQESR